MGFLLKGITTWIWIVGGIIIALMISALAIQLIYNTNIETHRQHSLKSFRQMVGYVNSLCDMNEDAYFLESLRFSSITDEIFALEKGQKGKQVLPSGITTGTMLCINITGDLECENLDCMVEIIYISHKENLLSLIDALSGNIGFRSYRLEFSRTSCGVSVTKEGVTIPVCAG